MTDQVNEAVAWMFEQEEYGEWVTRLSLSREAGEGEGKRNLRPLTHPSRGVVDEKTLTALRDMHSQEVTGASGFLSDEANAYHAANRDALAAAIAALQAAQPAVPSVPEGEWVTLTVAQIADLARFAGLTLAQSSQPAQDELEAQITVCECPDTGVLLDGDYDDPGTFEHYTHIAYYSEYRDEGCIGLGPEIATPKDQPAQGVG